MTRPSPPPVEPEQDIEVQASKLAEAWMKDRGDAPYLGIARSVTRFILGLPSTAYQREPEQGDGR